MELTVFITFLLFASSLSEQNYIIDGTINKDEGKIYDMHQLGRDFAGGIETAQLLEREKEYLGEKPFQDNINLLNYANIVPVLLNSPSNASKGSCFQDISYLLYEVQHVNFSDIQNSWALKMIDSYGKLESSILEGNFKWLGDYDECRSVYAPKKNNSDIGGFNGKYCSLVVKMGILPLTIGLCLPETCDSSDFGEISSGFSNILSFLNNLNNGTFNISTPSINCKANSLEISSGGIVTICIISLFLLWVLLGSSITAFKYFTDSATSDDECHNDNDEEINLPTIPDRAQSGNGISQDQMVYCGKSSNKFKALIDKCDPFFNCFCIFTNGSKLLNTDATEGQLLCLHGIRFLSMSWVILCHVYSSPLNAFRSVKSIIPYVDNLPFQAMVNGFYSVDSFFVLSGFLMSYLYFQDCAKRKGGTPWVYFYVHRYLRLTPVYMIALAFLTSVLPVMGSGPFWANDNVEPNCHKGWWMNLLYINNFQDQAEHCMSWTWYLANDMQFFVISPLFLITLWRWPKVGYTILAFFLCGSCLSAFLITYQNDLLAGAISYPSKIMTDPNYAKNWDNYMNKIYVMPYTRIATYLIGIGLGHILFKRKLTDQKVSQTTLWIGWLLAVPSGLYCVYGVFHQTPSLLAASFFNAFIRTIYGLSVSWLIFVCLSGQGGLVDKILSYKLFIPLSRLTYCAYLIHPLVIGFYTGTLRTTVAFSHSMMVLWFLGFLIITYAFSMLVSLTFESPLIRLEKVVKSRFQTK